MKAFLSNSPGKSFSDENYTVIKKSLANNEVVDKHSHPGNDVIITIVKGKIKVLVDDEEKYELDPGKILKFDGVNSVAIKAIEPSDFFVTLIKK
ncbi:DUF1637 domain-containing protein [Peptoniphilus sp.]|jgi:quercetin dioxygenase-like cupin family protein|uniref:DUF1637 domain-containing protein n=1 Tax=Peptoniphilus sp. TaxID=1971214 RepID=UPI003D901B62